MEPGNEGTSTSVVSRKFVTYSLVCDRSLISGYGFSSVLLWMRQLETAQDSTSERTYAP